MIRSDRVAKLWEKKLLLEKLANCIDFLEIYPTLPMLKKIKLIDFRKSYFLSLLSKSCDQINFFIELEFWWTYNQVFFHTESTKSWKDFNSNSASFWDSCTIEMECIFVLKFISSLKTSINQNFFWTFWSPFFDHFNRYGHLEPLSCLVHMVYECPL